MRVKHVLIGLLGYIGKSHAGGKLQEPLEAGHFFLGICFLIFYLLQDVLFCVVLISGRGRGLAGLASFRTGAAIPVAAEFLGLPAHRKPSVPSQVGRISAAPPIGLGGLLEGEHTWNHLESLYSDLFDCAVGS